MPKVTIGGYEARTSGTNANGSKLATVSESGTKVLLDVSSQSAALATRVEEASASVTYVGKAAIGSATSADVWQIMKLGTSGSLTSTTWADGDSSFDNVWDDRASLSYS